MQPCPVLRLPVTQQWKRNGTTHFTFSQRCVPGGLKVLRDFLAAREFTSRQTQCRLELAVYRKKPNYHLSKPARRISPWFGSYSRALLETHVNFDAPWTIEIFFFFSFYLRLRISSLSVGKYSNSRSKFLRSWTVSTRVSQLLDYHVEGASIRLHFNFSREFQF